MVEGYTFEQRRSIRKTTPRDVDEVYVYVAAGADWAGAGDQPTVGQPIASACASAAGVSASAAGLEAPPQAAAVQGGAVVDCK